MCNDSNVGIFVASFDEVDGIATHIKTSLDNMQTELYSHFKVKYKEIPAIDIQEPAPPTVRVTRAAAAASNVTRTRK